MIRLALTGSRGCGKTSLLVRVAHSLQARGTSVGGVVQPVVTGGGERQGYDLVDLKTGLRRQLARRPAEWVPGERGFVFQTDAWPDAARSLTAAVNTCDVTVVDELGLLEANGGGGHMPAVRGLLDRQVECAWVFCLRRDVATDLLLGLGVPRINLIDLDEVERERAEMILVQRLMVG